MVKCLAVCSSEREIKPLLEAIEKMGAKKDCVILSLCELEARERESRVIVKEYWDYISKQDIRRANNSAIDLIQGWYKFDKDFEKAIEFEGISLGIISVSAIKSLFSDAVWHLTAVSNAVQKEKPDIVIAGKNCMAGRVVRAAAKKAGIKKAEFLDFGPEPALNKWPNVSTIKFFELLKKTREIFSRLAEGQGKGRLVFVRSRGAYLPRNVEIAIKKSGLSVYSLDLFLLKRMLNPKNMLDFLKARNRMPAYFANAVKKFESSRGFAENMAFEGMPLNEIFNARIQRFVSRDWPEFVFLISEIRALFTKRKPKALLLWTDVEVFERICTLIAKEQGIPSLVAQHGIFSTEIEKEKNDRIWITGFTPMLADRIAIWGPFFKKELEKKGIPDHKIVITGTPKFDFLKSRRFKPAEFRKKIGVKESETLVTLIMSSDHYMEFRMIDMAFKALKKFPGCKFVVKVHPSEAKGKYLKMAEKLGKSAIVLQAEDLYELMNASALVVVHASTVGIEAVALGKPVIVITKKHDHAAIYLRDCGLPIVGTQAGFEKAIVKTSLPKKDFLYDFAFRQDGKAGERIAALVKQMTLEKKQD